MEPVVRPQRWYGKRNRVIFLGTVLGLMLGLLVFAAVQVSQPRRADAASSGRTLEVTKPYTLLWKASSGAPELRMLVQVADFGLWQFGRHPVVADTAEGPARLSVAIAMPGADGEPDGGASGCGAKPRAIECATDRAQMSINRQRMDTDGNQAVVNVETVWINEVRGAPVFLGFDCSVSQPGCYRPAGVEKLFGGWFGLRKLTVVFEGTECRRRFELRGRAIDIDSHHACSSVQSKLAFKAGLQVIRRMMDDAALAPTPETQRKRSLAALDNCKAQALPDQPKPGHDAGFLCGYALQLLRARLESEPGTVAEQMVSLMALQAYAESPWDRWFLEEAVAALGKAGEGASPVAYRAEGLLFRRLIWGDRQEELQAARDSLAKLAAQVPKLNSLDFALYETVERSMWAGSRPEERGVEAAAFLRAWYDRVKVLEPTSDAALKIRNQVCAHMAYRGVARAVLKECADALLAAWAQKEVAGQPVGFEKASWLAPQLVHMYLAYGFGTLDVPGAINGLLRLRQFLESAVRTEPEIGKALEELAAAERSLAELARKPAVRG